MSKKWILYIGGFNMPDRNAAAQRVMGNAKAFRDLGYNTFFIGLSKTEDLCIQEYEDFKYINLKYPESLKDWLLHLSSIKKYTEYLDKDPDIIIAYNFPAIALSKLRLWCKKKSILLISDCTEWYEAKGNIIFRLLKGFDTWYRMKIIQPKMDGIIAISDYLYDYYSTKVKRVVNIPPLVDISMDKWKLVDSNEVLHNDNVSFIYAGSPGNKNKDRIDVLLEAFSAVKDDGISNFNLKILGITYEQYLKLFESPIPQNLLNHIDFKGRLSHVETLYEIKKSHFFIFVRNNNLSNIAGFPTKFSESISCGTPVITNSTSNLCNFITNGQNGFIIDSFTVPELVKVIKHVINLPKSQISKMKHYCYTSQQFDYKKYITKFEELVV